MKSKVRIITGGLVTEPDPAKRPFIEVTLPPGFRLVRSGAVKPRDLYLDPVFLAKGHICWMPIQIEDMGDAASDYMAVLRRGVFEQTTCCRCKAYEADEANEKSFCCECAAIIETAWRG